MKKLNLALVTLSILCIGLAQPVEALKIKIYENKFYPEKNKITSKVIYTNDSDRIFAGEAYVQRLRMGLDRKEDLVDSENFLIYPSQILLKPGESKTSIITWVGEIGESEEVYRLVSEQVELNGTKIKPNEDQRVGVALNVLYKYMNFLIVRPGNTAPNVQLVEAKPLMEDGVKKLSILFNNKGTSFKVLEDLEIEVKNTGSNNKQLIPKKNFPAKQILYAGDTIQFTVDWPNGLKDENIEAEFSSLN